MSRPTSVLLLNADYKPVKVIGWQRAVLMLLDETADLVQSYPGLTVRSASLTMDLPAVISLRRYMNFKARLRFNRQNVLARDAHTCCYCGNAPRLISGRPDIDALTIDHVVPRAQSKNGMVTLPWSGQRVSVTCWHNILTSCIPCNSRKADRTPEQAGMKPAKLPHEPSASDTLRMTLQKIVVPQEWSDYV